MTESEKVAYVLAQAVAASSELCAMLAANWTARQQIPEEPEPYDADVIRSIQTNYCIGHNAVLALFNS